MWKRACDTAANCIADAKGYNKQRYDKTHMEPDFKEGEKAIVSTFNFNNFKGPNEMRDSYVVPFTIIKHIGKNAMEVRLTEEFSRKHPVFQEQDIVEVDDSPCPVKNVIKARKIILNGKDQRQSLVRFKSQTAGKNKWLAEDAIPHCKLHLKIFRALGRAEKSHQL
ncbi:hypothetical protein O181_001374 [Austropuccinia psidii MF-1]|uniref:Uncharacterized protein n=1 Tax=Austropuccinia psidii MF-1 TaxID=1389203 RepID=A0A9Q3BAD3_9BASI|nr:hypothetical protein [Austropuccinia psidii MF-1]